MRALVLVGLLLSGAVASDKDKRAEVLLFTIGVKSCHCIYDKLGKLEPEILSKKDQQECYMGFIYNLDKENKSLVMDYVEKKKEDYVKPSKVGFEACKSYIEGKLK